MSKIETASKVLLKLASRINLGRRGALTPSSRPCIQPTSSLTAPKGPGAPPKTACSSQSQRETHGKLERPFALPVTPKTQTECFVGKWQIDNFMALFC